MVKEVMSANKDHTVRYIQYVFVSGCVGVLCVCYVTSLLSSQLLRFPRSLVDQKTVFVPEVSVTLHFT